MGLPKLSTGAIKGKMREAFDEWFAGCPLHRQRVEDNYSDHTNGSMK